MAIDSIPLVLLALSPWLIGLALLVFALVVVARIARALERIATALEAGGGPARPTPAG